MSHAKQDLKRRRRSIAVPLLGAAGLSLSLASGASAATDVPAADSVRRTPQQTTKSFSVKRKSLTSVWRRSMSSTMKTPEHCRAYNLPGEAAEAAVAAEAASEDAEAASEGAEAAEAAEAAVAAKMSA